MVIRYKRHYLPPTRWLLLSGVIFLISLSGCSRDRHDHPGLTTGAALFNHHCEECHGEDGTGKLVKATPANILTKLGRQGIISYITAGDKPGRNMPVFHTMPASEAAAIADHLLGLKRTYEETPPEKKKLRMLMVEP